MHPFSVRECRSSSRNTLRSSAALPALALSVATTMSALLPICISTLSKRMRHSSDTSYAAVCAPRTSAGRRLRCYFRTIVGSAGVPEQRTNPGVRYIARHTRHTGFGQIGCYRLAPQPIASALSAADGKPGASYCPMLEDGVLKDLAPFDHWKSWLSASSGSHGPNLLSFTGHAIIIAVMAW